MKVIDRSIIERELYRQHLQYINAKIESNANIILGEELYLSEQSNQRGHSKE